MEKMTSKIPTSIGELTITKAFSGDGEIVLAIMREAANWLNEKGIPQWNGLDNPKVQTVIRQRAVDGVAYFASLNEERIGTFTILWEDASIWDEKGRDGLAGYIHGLAILRKFGGKNVGLEILKWAINLIKTEKPLARLDCMAENQRLCRYYEEIGFTHVGNRSFQSGWKSNLYEMKF